MPAFLDKMIKYMKVAFDAIPDGDGWQEKDGFYRRKFYCSKSVWLVKVDSLGDFIVTAVAAKGNIVSLEGLEI